MTAGSSAATTSLESPIIDTIRDAIGLLDEERRVFLTGTYEKIADITERKLKVLQTLEAGIRKARRSARLIAALDDLVKFSRRNELIIQAAREGLAHAKRRIAAVEKAERGAVAYAEDGSSISVAADSINDEASA